MGAWIPQVENAQHRIRRENYASDLADDGNCIWTLRSALRYTVTAKGKGKQWEDMSHLIKKKKPPMCQERKLFLALIFGVYHHDGALDGRQFFTVVKDAESRAHLPRFKSKACQLPFLYTQVIFNSLCLSFPIY